MIPRNSHGDGTEACNISVRIWFQDLLVTCMSDCQNHPVTNHSQMRQIWAWLVYDQSTQLYESDFLLHTPEPALFWKPITALFCKPIATLFCKPTTKLCSACPQLHCSVSPQLHCVMQDHNCMFYKSTNEMF